MLPLLYSDLAAWWPLLSAPEDYAEEAATFTALLQESCAPQTVLELGSGGGNNAFHMKAHFALTLVDLAPGMVAVSEALNPECPHRVGDMRTVRLGRTFDAVFIHDAIMYLTTEADLAATLETAFLHCRRGGVALLAPDYFAETFVPTTETGGHDGKDGRAIRYLEWSFDPDPTDTTAEMHVVLLLREGGEVRTVHDRHVFGLVARDRWLALCRDAGFEPEIHPWHHSEVERPLEAVLCRKPLVS
ncbi:MAG: class I SAM-dependent methyltransferase [Rhodothermaceae bacterium]|nr:class I SAM-dependent methyltransferase [Rhodothermaceae bacterium]